MENMNKKVKRMASGNSKRRLWHRVIAIPAAIVVFVTTYALVLPAIAMERDTYCGFEAHEHTDACYTAELACGYEDGATVQDVQLVTELACKAQPHQHTVDCYDEAGNVVCGYADYLVHEHTAECYAADGTLICPLPQVEAHTHDENCYVEELVNVCGLAESKGHYHTEACYSVVSHPELVCGLAESEGHYHTEDCYTAREESYLVCGQSEHAGHFHTEECYNEAGELSCDLAESEGHTHTDACYATELVMDLTCGKEETPGHTHTEACWADVESIELTCGKAESEGHTHSDACYAVEKRLVCSKPEVILHTHNDDCYTVTVAEDGTESRELTCTQTVIEEHIHTADCFNTIEQTIERPHEHTDLCYIQTLTCTLPEHEHTDACYIAPEAPEAPDYICGLEGHTHTELCYDEAGELVCGLEEHIHDESCLAAEESDGNVEIVDDETPAFQMPVLACGLAEHEHSTSCMDENMNYVCGVTAHTHTGACYEIPGLAGVTPVLVCDKHEHFHTEACYDANGVLACGLEEHTHGVGCFALPEDVEVPGADEPENDENIYWCGFEAHAHTDACYDANGETVCGLPEHEHTAECLVEPDWFCGYEAHTHSEACYDETGALTCVLPEHTHSDECRIAPVVFCGYEAHVHGASCYGEDGSLICEKEEHIHTAECAIQNFTQTAYDGNVMVTANYTSEAGFPADAMLMVTHLTQDGEHYEDRVDEALELFAQTNPDQMLQPLALLNIGFYLPDGTEVEPLAPVDINVQMLNADGLAEGEQYAVIHYGAAGTELLDAAGEETEVNFSTASFSDFLVNYGMDPSNGGSNAADDASGEEEEDDGGATNSVPSIFMNGLEGNVLISSSVTNLNNGIATIGNGTARDDFDYNKKIDYLGDGGNNMDTKVDGEGSFDQNAVTDDLYRLYLDMEGKSEPVDLVIVIDRSNSMKEIMSSGKSRWETVYNILEGTNSNGSDGLLYQFLKQNDGKTSNEERNFVSVVWFAGRFFDRNSDAYGSATNEIPPSDSMEGGTVLNWTSTYTHQGTGNYSISPYKGVDWGVACTNYVAGLYQADQKLNNLPSGTENHRKVVVFMSDGIPVYYYMASTMDWNNPGSMHRYGGGSEDRTYQDWSGSSLIKSYAGHSPANSFYESPYFNETKKIFNSGDNSFVGRHPNISFYTVAIDLAGETINGWPRTTLLQDMAASYTGGKMFSATNSDGLKEFLQSVMFPAGVTIQDTLSAYVDLYKTQPDIKVTATNKKTGEVSTLWSYMDQQLNTSGSISGTFGRLGGVSAENNIIQSVSYNNKTISVVFNPNYCLGDNYIYTLSFNVRLTAAAYDAYAQYGNTYNGVQGQTDTDYTGNSTSSGKNGLHSNDSATVKYKVDDESHELTYKHPVVQAWRSRFQVQKAVPDGKDFSNIQFMLKKSDGTTSGWKAPDQSGIIDFGYLTCGDYTLVEKVPVEYDSGVAPNREKKWMTFKVVKGRIIDVDKLGNTGVQWLDSNSASIADMSESDFRLQVNSTPNTSYNDGGAAVKVENVPFFKDLEVYKADEDGKIMLSNAKFLLSKQDGVKEDGTPNWKQLSEDELSKYAGENINIEVADDGKVYLVSGKDGLVFKGKLPYGTYRLGEEVSPKNFLRTDQYVTFTVTEEEGIVLKDTEATVAVQEAKGSVMVITIKDQPNTVDWTLRKVDGGDPDEEHVLADATFELYGPYDQALVEDLRDFRASQQPKEKLMYTGTTDKDGLLDAKALPDLEAGKYYYLVETKAPAGYNVADPIQIEAVEEAAVGSTAEDRVMKLSVKQKSGIVEYNLKDGETVVTIQVVNLTGYELPESGGIGTTVFTLSGLALLALAGAMFCANKRKSRS